MRIAITGAGGFIGSKVLEKLASCVVKSSK